MAVTYSASFGKVEGLVISVFSGKWLIISILGIVFAGLREAEEALINLSHPLASLTC